jgi:hypothetical protein
MNLFLFFKLDVVIGLDPVQQVGVARLEPIYKENPTI